MTKDIKSFSYEGSDGRDEHVWRGLANGNNVKVSISHSVVDPFSMMGPTWNVSAYTPDVGEPLGTVIDVGEYEQESTAIREAIDWMRRRSD